MGKEMRRGQRLLLSGELEVLARERKRGREKQEYQVLKGFGALGVPGGLGREEGGWGGRVLQHGNASFWVRPSKHLRAGAS